MTRVMWILLLLHLLSTRDASAAERLPAIEVGSITVERAVLANGLRVLAIHDEGAETVDVGIAYAVGIRHETRATSGLAHLTEHCMFAGTERLADQEYDERLREVGSEPNAYTRADYTFYYDHKLPPEALQLALDLEADRMANLTFPEDGFTREWKALLDEERRSHDDDQRRIGHLSELAFPDHPYGIGIKKGDVHTRAEHLTRADAYAFYQLHYRPGRAVLVISGAIDPAVAIELAEAEFAEVPARRMDLSPVEPGPAAPVAGPRDADVALGAKPTVLMAFQAPGLQDASGHATAQLVAGLLDRRLGELGGGAGLEERRDPYLLVLSLSDDDLSTSPAELEARVLEVVNGLRAESPGAESLEAVRKDVRNRYLERRLVDRPYFSLATDLAILEATTDEGAQLAARWHELVDDLDVDAVGAAARSLLAPENRVVLRCTPVPQKKRAFLGLQSEDAEGGGVIVTQVVVDTAAARARLRPGDVLIALDGAQIDNAEGFRSALAGHAAGDIVLLEIMRDGVGRQRRPVRLGERPASAGRTSAIERYKEAQRAAKQGRVDDAIAAYGELFERSEDRVMRVIYMTELGKLLAEAERYDEAIERFELGLAIVDYPATREMYEQTLAARDEARAATPAPPGPAGFGEVTVRFTPEAGGSRIEVEVGRDGTIEVTASGVERYEVETSGGAAGARPAGDHAVRDRRVSAVGHDLHVEIDLDGDLLRCRDRLELGDTLGGVLEVSLPDAEDVDIGGRPCRRGEHGELLIDVHEGSTDVEVAYSLPLSAVADVGKGLYLGSRSWYPEVVGSPLMTHRVTVRAPAGWRTVTQGARRVVDDRTTVWTARHPSDGLSLAAGPFEVVERKHGDVWLYGYFYAEDLHLAASYLDASARFLDLYNELLGPYPYRKFAIVENFLPTGYGMPSWTLLGQTVLRLPFIAETSLGHEICHNWWGNGVFVDRDQGNWSEGITTYCADHLYEERKSAAAGAAYRKAMLEKYAAYVPAGNEIPLSEFQQRRDDRTQAIGYGRVAMLFHELRNRCGQRGIDFWAILRGIVEDHRFEQVGWNVFSDAFAAAGLESDAWFRQRIESVDAPRLAIVGDELTGTWPEGGPAPQVKVLYREAEGTLLEHCTLEGNRATLAAPRPSCTERIADPHFDLFRRLDPREIDPTVAQVKGDGECLAVFAEGMERDEMLAYGQVASALGVGDHRRWRTSATIGQQEARTGPCLFLGMDATTAGFGWLRRREEVLAGGAAAGARAGRSPDDPEQFWLQVVSATPVGSEMLARKLPHYGKYSHVAFTEPGRVVVKRVIPSSVSPLRWSRP